MLYAGAVSKRPRPADPRQPDLFAPPPGPQAGPPEQAATPAARPRPARARPDRPKPARSEPAGTAPSGPDPMQGGPAIGAPAPGPVAAPSAPLPARLPDAAPEAAPAPRPAQPRAAPEPDHAGVRRPEFRRVDPLSLRAADRPDSFLYCVLTRDDAEAVLRDGLPDEPPALVERGAVPRHLAAAADDLGWSDEQPGALAVLRVRRTEIDPRRRPAPPPPHPAERRQGRGPASKLRQTSSLSSFIS